MVSSFSIAEQFWSLNVCSFSSCPLSTPRVFAADQSGPLGSGFRLRVTCTYPSVSKLGLLVEDFAPASQFIVQVLCRTFAFQLVFHVFQDRKSTRLNSS